jgi:hypothetical protein
MTLFSGSEQNQAAQRGDDGVDRKAALQNGEDPAGTTIVPANLLRSSPAVHTPERLLRMEIKGLGTP